MTSTKPTITHIAVDENLSVLLDFFRWFSALIVVIGHSRAIFFVPWAEVEQKNPIVTAFYFVSGWGGYGVLMFFAISGFLIGGGVLEKFKDGSFSFAHYFINRFTRIYIVLAPALVFVWVLDAAGLKWLNGLGIYTQGYPIGALGLDVGESTGLLSLILNFVMVQNVIVPPFGTAQPLWSLNWEWWSYMLAPFIVGLLLRIGGRWALAVSAALAAASVATALGYLLLWFLGILLALVSFKHWAALVLAGAACLLLPVATRAMLLPADMTTEIPFLLGFVLLVSQLRHITFPAWWYKFPHKWLAGFSFSTYVLHNTTLIFIMACLQTYLLFPRQMQPTLGNTWKYLLLLLVVGVVARIFAWLTEAHTDSLRRLIRRRFLPASPR